MNRTTLKITPALNVLLVEVVLIHILMSYETYFDNDCKEAGRTLTRDVILSLRTTVHSRPDRLTCLRIRSLGCIGHVTQ